MEVKSKNPKQQWHGSRVPGNRFYLKLTRWSESMKWHIRLSIQKQLIIKGIIIHIHFMVGQATNHQNSNQERCQSRNGVSTSETRETGHGKAKRGELPLTSGANWEENPTDPSPKAQNLATILREIRSSEWTKKHKRGSPDCTWVGLTSKMSQRQRKLRPTMPARACTHRLSVSPVHCRPLLHLGKVTQGRTRCRITSKSATVLVLLPNLYPKDPPTKFHLRWSICRLSASATGSFYCLSCGVNDDQLTKEQTWRWLQKQ